MNRIVASITHILLGMVLVLFTFQAVYGATQITGTVTAKRAGSVKVEFKPHKTAGPQSGDLVDFKTMMQGMEVNAGQGEVTESETNFAWVKITKGRPNLKMTAFIHATGEPGPVEYTFEFEGNEFQIQGKTYWYPGGVFRFKSVSTLKKTYSLFQFPEGGLLGRPLIDIRVGENLQKTHQEERENLIEYNRDHKVQFVWKDRNVQGLNTDFLVSQAIITSTIPPWSPEEWAKIFPDKKYVKRDPIISRDQKFIASFRIPTPPPDKRIYVEHFYKITFGVPDDVDEQYRPEYWEKIFLEILKSVSIDII